jgi:hypothetical protein
MLGESSSIELWGRLGKIGGEGVEGGIKANDLGEDEGEGGGSKVDMKQLAKTIDVEEIEKVLGVISCHVAQEVHLTLPHPLRMTSARLYSITWVAQRAFTIGRCASQNSVGVDLNDMNTPSSHHCVAMGSRYNSLESCPSKSSSLNSPNFTSLVKNQWFWNCCKFTPSM